MSKQFIHIVAGIPEELCKIIQEKFRGFTDNGKKREILFFPLKPSEPFTPPNVTDLYISARNALLTKERTDGAYRLCDSFGGISIIGFVKSAQEKNKILNQFSPEILTLCENLSLIHI